MFHCELNNVIYRDPYHALLLKLDDYIARLYQERQSTQQDFANDRELASIEAASEPAVEVYYNRHVFAPFFCNLLNACSVPSFRTSGEDISL